MNLRKDVSKALVARGFHLWEGRSHLIRVDADFSLGVDTGPLGKRSDIAPYVGIRHDGVQQLRADLMGSSANERTGTVGANVGYVLGEEYRRWEPPSTHEEVLRVIDLALGRLRQYLSLDRLPEAWKIRGTNTPGWRYNEIAALLLKGDHQAVLERLEAARAEYCAYEDGVCEQFRAFEQRVNSRYFSGEKGAAK